MLDRVVQRQKEGNYRKLSLKKAQIDLASNDTLGLARSPLLHQEIQKEWKEGIGSTGSRLFTGNSSYCEELEKDIAAFHGFQAGLIFPSGYMANVGLISCVAIDKDIIFYDTHVHASTYDGIRLAQAKSYPFRHNDLEHLKKRLESARREGRIFVCIESVYSTDGSMALLKEIAHLTKQYEAHLIVDEAHAVGVFGNKGRGLIKEIGDLFAAVVTFGKALGTHGAIVLGSFSLIEYLINFSRPFIYTTALPHYSLAAIRSSYKMFPTMDKEREHLKDLISFFRGACNSPSFTHIHPYPVKGAREAKQLSAKLSSLGIDVRALMSPTVKKGSESLRITLHSFNTFDEVATLLKHL